MALLANKDNSYNASCEITNEIGAKTSYSFAAGRDKLRREGTGSRKKPLIPDETFYERHEHRFSPPRGNGEWIAPGWVKPATFSGVPRNFWSSALISSLQNFYGDFDQNLVDQVNLSALQKFNKRDMDLGTAWKERGKTMGLLADLATVSVETLVAVKKRDGRGVLNALGLDHAGARARGVVDAHLAYQYGVRPLIQDINGALQSLTRMPPETWSVESKKWRFTDTDQQKDAHSAFNCFRTFSKLRSSVRVKISARQVAISREQDRLWSLGLDNPLATIYEVTPYSFVLDWALPIGDWLSALNSVKYYSGWETVVSEFQKETAKFSGTSMKSGTVAMKSTVSGGSYEMVHVRRRVINSLPMLGLPVKDPRSLLHMANALSLFASQLANGDQRRFVRY